MLHTRGCIVGVKSPCRNGQSPSFHPESSGETLMLKNDFL
jgi:hypothetical protein